jgi:hypothetical protein
MEHSEENNKVSDENLNIEIDKKLKRITKVDNELKYKSIYLNSYNGGNNNEGCNMEKLDNFLEKEKENNKSQPWNKLNKTNKIEKLKEFSKKYSITNDYSEEQTALLEDYLLKALDNKKFSKVKDITYIKDDGIIKDIPGLVYNKKSKMFTIKNQDNRLTTSKNLAPKTKKSKSGNVKSKKNKSHEKKE